MLLKYHLIWMVCILFSSFAYAQENDNYEKRWQEISDGVEYRKSSRPQGPSDDYISPQKLDEDRRDRPSSVEKSNDENIIHAREQRYNDGENSGVQKHIKEGENQSIDDLSSPETDAPKIERSYGNQDFSIGAVFKFLFIILAIALIIFLIYHFFFKNRDKANQKIAPIVYDETEEVNPETLQKSQLEKDLKAAIAQNDFRLGIRIYYILLLKSLINKNRIKWVKRKTNLHYLTEMSNKKEYQEFQKAIDIYEWTWYGKNNPNPDVFGHFEKFYNDLLKRLRNE